MAKAFQTQSIAWSKKRLSSLAVGGVLSFSAPLTKHRAIRKQASVTGEEQGMTFSVNRNEDHYKITRKA